MISWSSRKKTEWIFRNAYFVQRKFFNICVLFQCIVYWINFQNIYPFTYQKILLHTLFFVESLQCIFKFLDFCCGIARVFVLGGRLKLGVKTKYIRDFFFLCGHSSPPIAWQLVIRLSYFAVIIQVSFHLWGNKTMLKRQVCENCVQDCKHCSTKSFLNLWGLWHWSFCKC